MKKTIAIMFSMLFVIFSVPIQNVDAVQYSSDDFKVVANKIVNWKKEISGTGKCLFTSDYMSKSVSNSDGDWYAFYMGRLGFSDYPNNYLNAITDYVVDKYNQNGTLSDKYATDYHRLALAIKSVGGDPTNVGGHDLIADGVYNRGYTASLGRQGMNGWVWGLITLDSTGTVIPADSYYSREQIISEIMKYQLKDGGFSVLPTAKNGDVDMTAMALYALAPYVNDSKQYTYKQNYNKKSVTKTVAEVIYKGIDFLSSSQLDNGGFASCGVTNCESVSQVIMALCSLSIDPQNDSRFVKQGSCVDALMSFRNSDGGFIHDSGDSNAIATEQALGAVTALVRFYGGQTGLFDFSDGVYMTVFKPQTNTQRPSIPVESDSNNQSNSNNSSSNNTSTVTSDTNSTPQGAQNSVQSSSDGPVGTTTSSGDSNNKKEEDKDDKNVKDETSSKNSSSVQAVDKNIEDYAGSSDKANSSVAVINSEQSDEDGGIYIWVVTFAILGVVLISLFIGYCVYRRKKRHIQQSLKEQEDAVPKSVDNISFKVADKADESTSLEE